MDLVVLIDKPDFTVTGTGRLLKKAQAGAIAQADELLEQARARDALLHRQALEACEQARRRGLQEGLAQAEAQWATRLAQAAVARRVALRDLAPALVEMVVDATAVVLRGANRRQLMASALQAVDGLLKQARWARLRVHPSQADAAHETLSEFDARHGAAGIVTVVPDPSVQMTGCIFETDVGIADVGLDVQLATIRQALETAVTSLVAHSPDGSAAPTQFSQ